MTIIYSNFGDNDTLLLRNIWNGISDVTVVEIQSTTIDFESMIDEAITNEEDTLLICGHGSSNGLLHPDLHSGQYIIHENNVNLIHARNVIGIWCYASDFAIRHNLNGFFTSMFISNLNEAYEHGYTTALTSSINQSLEGFTNSVNMLIRNNVPLNEWAMYFVSNMDLENPIESYNFLGLRYFSH